MASRGEASGLRAFQVEGTETSAIHPKAVAKPPGGHLNISKVWVDDLDNPTSIMIFGEDLDFGSGPLTVTLGGFGELVITSSSPTQIDATLSNAI